MSWFKRGIQYDVKCNALTADGKKAKPAITVFSYEDSFADAIELAISELKKYGYSSITCDKIVRVK